MGLIVPCLAKAGDGLATKLPSTHFRDYATPLVTYPQRQLDLPGSVCIVRLQETVAEPELCGVTMIVNRAVLKHEIGGGGLKAIVGSVHTQVIAIEDVE